ncbi:bifunctional DNA primase/polymerase [Streptomyces beijiangensis]|uniref:Bifunctional DNA primase/polymerase n=1 Tax=Streptomyces beijiangensis TaxID=163361 RepID=A0A939F7I3_9ACTN|nr:bifunctional DNA primase/polymerase [Streptomyces beijiangensis]MBO0512382.1 bifunctional DNA primase/polymerase [Streptomyces beijiangensis]
MTAELRVFRSEQSFSGLSLATAKWCASKGWPVHPLAAGRKTPVGNCDACRAPGHIRDDCPCLRNGRWCHGFRAATLDPVLIERWWGTGGSPGVGVACGSAGLVVIDIDAHAQPLPERARLLPGIPIAEGIDLTGLANGFHTLGVLAALRGAGSPAADTGTLRVRTPSGGMHVWYRAHPGHRWQSSTGSGSGRALAWQVDIRAHGGYIVAPGVRTPNGAYTPVGTVREPALLPDWLAAELERTGHLAPARRTPLWRTVPPPRARQAVAAAGGRSGVPKALGKVLSEVADCAAVPEGAAFSEKLNRAAYTAGGLVAAGHLSRAEAERTLTELAAGVRPGQARRCEGIIRSGLRAGERHPLAPGSRP